MTTSEWLTVDEAAEMLDLTRAQVYRRIEAKRLLGVRRANVNGKERLVIPVVAVKEFQAGVVDLADNSPDLLRASDVANILGVSVERVRRLVKDGTLAAKFGGADQPYATIRVSRAVVEKYLSAE